MILGLCINFVKYLLFRERVVFSNIFASFKGLFISFQIDVVVGSLEVEYSGTLNHTLFVIIIIPIFAAMILIVYTWYYK